MVAGSLFPPVVSATDSICERVQIDGTELVETFHRVRRETGLKTWDATATKAFRAVFIKMLEAARTA